MGAFRETEITVITVPFARGLRLVVFGSMAERRDEGWIVVLKETELTDVKSNTKILKTDDSDSHASATRVKACL